jgi:hypothetical protein
MQSAPRTQALEQTGQRQATSLRAVAVGLVLVGAISLISPWAILMVKGSQLTSNAIPIIAVLLFFFVVALAVPVLKILGGHFAFARGELITVYAMMLVGSVVVTTGLTGSFLSVITGVYYYATPENNWANLFVPYVSPWLAPTDPEAVRFFFEGLPQDMSVPWEAWAQPLAVWIGFILVFYWVIFCLGVLLRGQWVENERLVYPLTRLPLALLEDVEEKGRYIGRFLCSRLMWLGFAIPLLLHSWNSMHNYHEAFQPMALNGAVSLLNGQFSIPFRLNLPITGLAYFMPLNVSFSIWFFFFVDVVQSLIYNIIGLQIGTGDIWNSGGASPIIAHQQAGAMVVLALFVLWTARSHIRGFWHHATGRGKAADYNEVIGPRTAIYGLGLGVALMVAWLTLTGLSFYVAVLLTLGALLVFIALSRVVCEAGVPGCQTPMVPQAFITRGFGPEILGLKNMTGLGYSTVWMGETAANMMNAVAHTLKLVSTENKADRRLPWALLAAVLVGLAGSIWFTMSLAYEFGGINLHGWYYSGAPQWPFRYMASVANSPEPSFAPRAFFTGLGATVMGGLLFLRQRFIWWPLHPIGFPISSTYTIASYGWFAIFLAWAFKGLILRYGGVRLYRSMLPFFLGLVFGEFFTACMWVFIDGALGVEGNMIFNF